MPEPNFYIKAGDTLPAITRTLEDAAGVAVDLTSAGTVTFIMWPIGGGSAITGTANIETPKTGGRVTYSWASGNTDTAGLYLAEWDVNWGGGTHETFPNSSYDLIQVTAQIT